MPPPYVSTPTWRYLELLRFEMGRTLPESSTNQGSQQKLQCKSYFQGRTVYVSRDDAQTMAMSPLPWESKRNQRSLVSVLRTKSQLEFPYLCYVLLIDLVK